MDVGKLLGNRWWLIPLMSVNILGLAPCMYLWIAFFQSESAAARFPDGGHNDIMFYILLIIAVILPFYITLFERLLISAYRKGKTKDMSRDHLAYTMLITRLAVIHVTFILGFVNFLVEGGLWRLLAFYPIGAAWSIIYWPSRIKFTRLLQRLEAP